MLMLMTIELQDHDTICKSRKYHEKHDREDWDALYNLLNYSYEGSKLFFNPHPVEHFCPHYENACGSDKVDCVLTKFIAQFNEHIWHIKS